ncbi:MAG: hypothetical protein HRT44_13290 [Bdellovibrionales bacterium]|nr:hypothetical protein [Bdellovibrionales bacterium]
MFSEAGVKIQMELANEAGQKSMVDFDGRIPSDGRITRIQFAVEKELRPIDYSTEKVSVGLTETFLLFALNINGVSRLRNAALEPEIMNIINFLNESWGTTVISVNESARTITIDPTGNSLKHIPSRPPQRPVREMPVVEYVPLPDRINFSQYVSMALESGQTLTLHRVSLNAIQNQRDIYSELGIEIKPIGFPDSNGFYSVQITPPTTLRATDKPIVFRPYPDLPTDIKDHVKFMLARFGQPGHRYEVHEYVYTSRFDSNIFLRLFGTRVDYDPVWNEAAQRWDAQAQRDSEGETHSVEYIHGGSMTRQLNVSNIREPDFYIQNLNDLRLAHMNIYALATSQSPNGRVYALTQGGIPLRGATTKMFTDFLNTPGNPAFMVTYATPAQVRAMEAHPDAAKLYDLLSHDPQTGSNP